MTLRNLILSRFHVKSKVCSVEVKLQDNGHTFCYSILRRKGEIIDIIESGQFSDLEEGSLKSVANDMPVNLIFTGKAIVLKLVKINESSSRNPQEIVSTFFPTISFQEFYSQVYFQDQFNAIIVLARKEHIDKVLVEFQKVNRDLAAVFLGIPAVLGLQMIIPDGKVISTSDYKIETKEGLIERIELQSRSVDEPINLDGLVLSGKNLLSVAGGFCYLLDKKVCENCDTSVEQISVKHIEKNKLRFLVSLAIIIAFFISCVNLLFYFSFFKQNNALTTQLDLYKSKYEQVNKVVLDYQKNKNLIESLGILSSSRLGECCDKLAATVPAEVLLTELYLNPIKNNNNYTDSIANYETGHIILKGYCKKSFVLNEWLDSLKIQTIVADISLENFTYNSHEFSPNFEIRIHSK